MRPTGPSTCYARPTAHGTRAPEKAKQRRRYTFILAFLTRGSWSAVARTRPLSGGAIDAMDRDVRMAIASGRALPRSTAVSLDAVARLVDLQITRWTRRQAFAVSRAVLGRTQQQIGDEWLDRPITQQSVAQHLTAAGWNAIEYAVRVFETIFESDHDDPSPPGTVLFMPYSCSPSRGRGRSGFRL